MPRQHSIYQDHQSVQSFGTLARLRRKKKMASISQTATDDFTDLRFQSKAVELFTITIKLGNYRRETDRNVRWGWKRFMILGWPVRTRFDRGERGGRDRLTTSRHYTYRPSHVNIFFNLRGFISVKANRPRAMKHHRTRPVYSSDLRRITATRSCCATVWLSCRRDCSLLHRDCPAAFSASSWR